MSFSLNEQLRALVSVVDKRHGRMCLAMPESDAAKRIVDDLEKWKSDWTKEHHPKQNGEFVDLLIKIFKE